MIKLAITGSMGRIGQRIAALAIEDKQFSIVSVMERSDHSALGQNYGSLIGQPSLNLTLSSALQEMPDVLIDFTSPASTVEWAEVCKNHGISLVVGTTGLGDKELNVIKKASQTIPVVQSPNMSVGMNLLFKVVGEMAAALGPDYDIEVVEQHHRFKKDSPSGSALGLVNSITASLGKSTKDVAVYGREGKEAIRKPGEIGVHAVRLGDTVGEHVVYFGSLGETVSIAHSAHNRDTFVQGALRAASWIMDRDPGLYSMQDVLFSGKGK